MDNDIDELVLEATAIGDLIDAIEKGILEIKEELKNKEYGADASNVIYVDFTTRREVQLMNKKKFNIKTVLALYHEWADRTHTIMKNNRGKYRNKKLLSLLEDGYAISASVRNLFAAE